MHKEFLFLELLHSLWSKWTLKVVTYTQTKLRQTKPLGWWFSQSSQNTSRYHILPYVHPLANSFNTTQSKPVSESLRDCAIATLAPPQSLLRNSHPSHSGFQNLVVTLHQVTNLNVSGDNWMNYKTYQPQTCLDPLTEVSEMLTVYLQCSKRTKQ